MDTLVEVADVFGGKGKEDVFVGAVGVWTGEYVEEIEEGGL